MSPPLLTPNVLCGLMLACALTVLCTPDCTPRKSVPYESNHFKVFREEGISNYSSMLMREDLGLLIVGAREAIYALDIKDISLVKDKVSWQVTQAKQSECTYKGKHPDIDCRNYIRTLHQIGENVMYVCGTNAFNPICDNLAYVDGRLKLEGKQEEGKGKCPFDPSQRYSSIVVDGDLYSATVLNFLGSEPVVLRSSQTVLRTEFKSSWLNEPNFVYMDVVPESVDSPEGDDDKIYIFFSENAVEYDFYNKLIVSRVARVCKGDRGGQRTLQRRWTSFLKASLECPVPGNILPFVVQDVFQVRNDDWRKSVFYAVFTSQSTSNDMSSAVCAYSVLDMNKVFSYGKYKTPITVEASHVKWVMYTGDPPIPRPGACINNAARDSEIQSSLDLPDKTLQFIRDRPLMDDSVKPLTGEPLLVRRGISFTRIVVDRIIALDGQPYLIMFIGTDNGFVQKAVNYNGEMHIIEELQLFKSPEPISVLRLSMSTGQLYAGTASGVVQMPLADCGRYSSCLDCVLARDPYCAWDLSAHHCTALPSQSKDVDLVQSLKEGNASRCPDPDPLVRKNRTLVLGNNIKLPCQQDSSLAQVNWQFDGQPLNPSSRKYSIYNDGLLIYNASVSDAGRYTCKSVEQAVSRRYHRTLAVYELRLVSDKGDKDQILSGVVTKKPHMSPTAVPNVDPASPQRLNTESSWVAMQVALVVVSVMMAALLLWNLYMGHLQLQRCCRQQHKMPPHCDSVAHASHQDSASDSTEPQAGLFLNAENNHRNGNNVGSFKYTIDESEI
ncbi:semaphorin-4E [Colossoma macropomum]|uniref:semaphorin-4E n=1 Tax=Colossoma macropomum TaxID=42526 RepID=UPI0018652379|nr:semaphorin-4E [Colossoma macropomum]XP_036441984.1 semaphorin-4E [Colossoma macropomum]